LLLAACIGLTVVVWKSYGDVAKKKITRLGTQLVLTSSLSPEEPAQPGGPALEADLPNAAPPAAPPVEIAAEAVVPAATSADAAQLLQSMARDLATLGHEVEQLKASMEQLKASQQQNSERRRLRTCGSE